MILCPRCLAERALATTAEIMAARDGAPAWRINGLYAESYGYLKATVESLLCEADELQCCVRHVARMTA